MGASTREPRDKNRKKYINYATKKNFITSGEIWTKVCCDAPWVMGYLRYHVYWGNAMRVGFSVKGPGQLLVDHSDN